MARARRILPLFGGIAVFFVCSLAAGADEPIEAIVARGLGYFSDGIVDRQYSVTEPWRSLTGETGICARLEIPDGRGGWSPTTDYSMFFVTDGKIVNMVKDNSLFGCPNRTYYPLEPLSRPGGAGRMKR